MTTIQINDEKVAIYFKRDRYLNGQLKLVAVNAVDHSTLFELTKQIKDITNFIVCRDSVCGIDICAQLINNNVFNLEYSFDYSDEKLHAVNFK